MKVVYSLLASLVVGAIAMPMVLAQNPYSPAQRYPTLATPVVAQAPTPAPKSATPSTTTTGTTRLTAPTPAPAANTNVNSTRIVTEQRPTMPTVAQTVAPIVAEPVPAQEPIIGAPIAIAPTQHVPLSLSALQPTTEMWFYEQMRQDYNNPTLQVRRNSERAAAERKARIAASEWYGMSNSRPIAFTTPHMYHYSPMWAGNSRRPWYWTGSTTSINIDARRVPTMGVSGIGTW